MSEELKPCPFCGGKVMLRGGGMSQDFEEVWCKDCFSNVNPRIWNTHTPDTSAKVDMEDAYNAAMDELEKQFNDPQVSDFFSRNNSTRCAWVDVAVRAALQAPRSDTSAVELVLGYHKFADAVEHDLAVPLYLRGLAGVAKTKAEAWLKKQGA